MRAELFDRMEEVTWDRWRRVPLHFVKFLAFPESSPAGERREGGRTNGHASLICSECGFNDTAGTLRQLCGVKVAET